MMTTKSMRCFSVGLLLSLLFLSPGCRTASLGLHPALDNPDPQAWERKQALDLYHEAWQVVFSEYVDPTFNGQNWYRWKDRYDAKIQTRDDAYVAVRTMLASLNDVYSRFLDPHRAEDQNMHIDSRLSGVGIQLAEKDNHLVVITTIDASPAKKAGILSLDQVVAVNDEPTLNKTLDQVVEKIRGPKGTQVSLSILRKNKPLTFQLQRDEIVIKSVFGDPVTKDIGYIRLSSFISQDTAQEMRTKLLQQQKTQAMILDIRGNSGGLLPNALEIADMFLGHGKIVSIVDRNHIQRAFDAKPSQLYDKPMVLLIDRGSASASEILGGALQDNHRATLIGTRSFGKGLVQRINYLQDGSELNLTISKYLTPSGQDINQTGIAPDIEVGYTLADFKANRDPQKQAAVAYLMHHR